MPKTLASKHRSTVTKMARKYKATIDTPNPADRCSAPRAVVRSALAGPRDRARWRCGGPSPPWPAGPTRPP
ncbi:hypothetical protein ACWCW2_27335, partial [Streptomyces sp. NPDC001773]